MKFERVTAWAEVSECGQYSIAAAKQDDRYAFTAFYGKQALDSFPTAEEARNRCRAHEQTRLEA